MVSGRSLDAIGTRCEVLATNEVAADAGLALARQRLAALDEACSRFRPDSELSRLRRGSWQSISPLLTEVLAAALRTAGLTGGLVDPTVGQALIGLGYDRDFAAVRSRQVGPETGPSGTGSGTPRPATRPGAVPGHHRVLLDRTARQVLVPRGVVVDVGASAKAWAADWIARSCARQLGAGFLVNLGGDLAIAGRGPVGGWRIAVDDGDTRADERPVVTLTDGAMATSSTGRRTWRQDGRQVHHIVDPRTGDCATSVWRSVTVTAASCELANAASTAAIVLGTEAPLWLARRGLPARLTSHRGVPVFVGDWPHDEAPTRVDLPALRGERPAHRDERRSA